MVVVALVMLIMMTRVLVVDGVMIMKMMKVMAKERKKKEEEGKEEEEGEGEEEKLKGMMIEVIVTMIPLLLLRPFFVRVSLITGLLQSSFVLSFHGDARKLRFSSHLSTNNGVCSPLVSCLRRDDSARYPPTFLSSFSLSSTHHLPWAMCQSVRQWRLLSHNSSQPLCRVATSSIKHPPLVVGKFVSVCSSVAPSV